MIIEKKKNWLTDYYLVKAGDVFRRRADYCAKGEDAPIYLKLNKELMDESGECFDCVDLATGALRIFLTNEDVEILSNAKVTIYE